MGIARRKRRKRVGVQFELGTHLFVDAGPLSRKCVEELKKRFTRSNSEFFRKRKMGVNIYALKAQGIEPEIQAWAEVGTRLALPRGAAQDVADIVEQHDGLVPEVVDCTDVGEPLKVELQLEPRPYQEKAAKALASRGGYRGFRGNSILRGPCGSGKTSVLLQTIARIGRSAIVLVNSKDLMAQWVTETIKWFGFTPGTVGGGHGRVVAPMTIATDQTLYSELKRGLDMSWISRFGVMVGDEVHHWAAPMFSRVAELFTARHRVGASADERRKDGKDWLIRDTFGPVVYEIGKGDLQERGHLVPVHMRVVTTEHVDGVYSDSVDAPGVSADWTGMVTRLNRDEERNRLIEVEVMRALEDPHAKVLLLNDRVEACRDWAARISARIGVERCGLLLGKARRKGSKKTNERTLAGLRGGVVRFAAGTSVADEGLDVPSLTHVFVTCPSHTHLQRLEQRAGRCARPFENKKHGTVVYFWDYRMFPHPGADGLTRLRERRSRFVDRFFKAVDEVEVVSGRREHGHQEAQEEG